MICEVNNAYRHQSAEILTPKLNKGFNQFLALIDRDHSNYKWIENREMFLGFLRRSTDNESLCRVSKRELLMCYPEGDYIKIRQDRLKETDHPEKYATIQTPIVSRKRGYDESTPLLIRDRFKGITLVEVGGRESLGLPRLGYLIKNAKFHIGIDSGMTHFALSIKDKNEVFIHVSKEKKSGVALRWMRDGYNVIMI